MGEISKSLLIRGKKTKRIKGIFDSGASNTYINKRTARYLGLINEDYYRLIKISNPFTGKIVNTKAWMIGIYINDRWYFVEASLLENMKDNLIIGQDILQNATLKLDFSNDKISTRGKIRRIKRI